MVDTTMTQDQEALKTRLSGPNWFEHLPWVLFGLRTTVKDDLGCSPAKLVYGSPISIPGNCLPINTAPSIEEQLASLQQTVHCLKSTPTAHHSATPQTNVPLPPSKHVFIRCDGVCPPLSTAYDGPFKVINQTDKVVTIERGSNTDTMSVDRCKPAVIEAGEEVQQPPPWGRPPGRHWRTTQDDNQSALPPPSPPTPSLPPSSTLPASTNSTSSTTASAMTISVRCPRRPPCSFWPVKPPWGEAM